MNQTAETPLPEIIKELLSLPSVMHELRTEHLLIVSQKLAAERALKEREAELISEGRTAGITGRSEKDREKQLRGLTRDEHRKLDELTMDARGAWAELQHHRERFLAILGTVAFRDETFVARLTAWMAEEGE